MDGIEEEEGAHSLIKVLTVPSEVVQTSTFVKQLLQGEAGAGPFQRLIAEICLRGRDDANELWHSAQQIRTARRPSHWPFCRASVWASASPPPWLSSGNPWSPGVSGPNRSKGPHKLGNRPSRGCLIPAKVYCPRSSRRAPNCH